HRRADGDPVDYGGVPEAPKDDLDEDFWNHEVNQYVTVYRKNEFVWGYSPSQSEMEEKKTNYEMTSQVTDPLMNPSEDHVELERAAPVIEVRGWAEVTGDGVIDDIWANGERIDDLSNVIAYNFDKDRFDYNIDVPMSNGGNVVDITIFGGPIAECEDCYGCTFSNHHFYVEFSGAEQYPATMTLWEDGSPMASDTVQADSSSFSIILQDKNGNRDTSGVDTLHAGVKVKGRDSLTMTLVETEVSSGTFRSAGTLFLVSDVTDTSENRLFIQGGDQVVVRYEDPTDPTDVVVQNLYAKSDFPVPLSGFIKDTDGDGRADRVVVDYSKILNGGVDSLMVPFPSDMESFKFMDSAMSASGYRLTISDNTVFPEYTTSFAEGNSGEGMSWLDPGSGTKESPVTIYDSIGPVLTQGILVETGYSDRDSMVISLSEDIRLTDLESESLILISGGTESSLEVLDAESIDNGMISVTVRGSVRPSPGDSVRLASDGSITDMFNNIPHPDNRAVGLSFIAGPIPVSSGRYYDSNADGIIDSLYLKFAKRVPVDSLRHLNLRWQSNEYTIGIENIVNPSDSVLAVDLSGIVEERATSGEMSVNAEYEELGASEYHIINDRAAPVILGAVYIPGQEEDGSSESTGDSLRVVFSEGIKSDSISFPEPFNTVKREDSSPYSIQFEPSGAVVKGSEATFSVSSVDPMPEEGDLINISVSGGISDMFGNSQGNPDNRQEEIIVKPIEPEFSILAHNPARGEYGDIPKMLMDSTAKVNSGAVVQINSGTNIRDDNDKVEFRISVEIYDVVGNYITGCSNQDASECDHIEFVTLYSGGRKDFVVWSLKNRNNRFVDQGNYSVHVKVESVIRDNLSPEITKEFDNIAKFAEEDCIISVRKRPANK
ncbi:MAG: hypothetical protein ACOCSE_05395, partial [Chitinivibrionales bacterium]